MPPHTKTEYDIYTIEYDPWAHDQSILDVTTLYFNFLDTAILAAAVISMTYRRYEFLYNVDSMSFPFALESKYG